MNIRTEVKVWALAIIMVVGLIVTLTVMQHKQDNASCAQALSVSYQHATTCAGYWRGEK